MRSELEREPKREPGRSPLLTPRSPVTRLRVTPRLLVTPGLLVAAVAVAVYQLCFFAAVARTGVAIGTVVAIGSGPVFTGLLSWMLHRERPSRRWAMATAAAVCGCAALIVGGGAQAGGQMVSGVLFALLGGLLYAFYAVTAARAISTGGSSNAVMGVMFGGAAVIMVPILLWRGTEWLAEPRGLLAALVPRPRRHRSFLLPVRQRTAHHTGGHGRHTRPGRAGGGRAARAAGAR